MQEPGDLSALGNGLRSVGRTEGSRHGEGGEARRGEPSRRGEGRQASGPEGQGAMTACTNENLVEFGGVKWWGLTSSWSETGGSGPWQEGVQALPRSSQVRPGLFAQGGTGRAKNSDKALEPMGNRRGTDGEPTSNKRE